MWARVGHKQANERLLGGGGRRHGAGGWFPSPRRASARAPAVLSAPVRDRRQRPTSPSSSMRARLGFPGLAAGRSPGRLPSTPWMGGAGHVCALPPFTSSLSPVHHGPHGEPEGVVIVTSGERIGWQLLDRT
jgi:hypothetical protein